MACSTPMGDANPNRLYPRIAPEPLGEPPFTGEKVTSPTALRMPYGPSGTLKAVIGPAPADYLNAPDIKGLNWVRRYEEAWTTAPFRAEVLRWLRLFVKNHTTIRGWQIVESQVPERTFGSRVASDESFLRLKLVHQRRPDQKINVEVSLSFPGLMRTDTVQIRSRLAQWEPAIEAQLR